MMVPSATTTTISTALLRAATLGRRRRGHHFILPRGDRFPEKVTNSSRRVAVSKVTLNKHFPANTQDEDRVNHTNHTQRGVCRSAAAAAPREKEKKQRKCEAKEEE
jgi:hypothetical protein